MREYEEWCPDHDGSHCLALIKLEERIEAIEARFKVYDDTKRAFGTVAHKRKQELARPDDDQT